MRSLMTMMLIVLLGSGGCPAEPERSSISHSDSTDTGQCPPGIEQQEFIDDHLEDMCRWGATCPDFPDPAVEDCVRRFTSYYNSRPGWDECNAVICVEWLADPPQCTTHYDLLETCNQLKSRDD